MGLASLRYDVMRSRTSNYSFTGTWGCEVKGLWKTNPLHLNGLAGFDWDSQHVHLSVSPSLHTLKYVTYPSVFPWLSVKKKRKTPQEE